jgi:hypothetical protein
VRAQLHLIGSCIFVADCKTLKGLYYNIDRKIQL